MRYFRCALIAIAMFLFASSPILAQIRGVVTDATDNTPIAGARVTLRSADGNTSRQTHANGEFSFETTNQPKDVTLHAYGYRDTIIAADQFTTSGEPLPIKLELNIALHFDVTVTAQKKLEAIQDVPVSVSTVRAPEIESRAPSGLDNVLRYIPGVSVTESEVNIRGSSGYARSIGSRVLLLMDGMPFLSADNGDVKFDALPLFDVERVEVVKGAGSALYGSSALGGVINVITRRPASGTHVAIMSTAGEYDQPSYDSWRVPGLGRRFLDGDIGVSSSAGDNAALLSAGFKRNEGYRLGDDYYRLHAFGKFTHRLNESSSLTFSGLVANEDHGGWLYWKSLAQPLEPSDSLSAINGRIHSLKANAFGKYTATIGNEILADVNVNLIHTKFTTDPTLPGGPDGNHSTADALNFETDISLPLTVAWYLTSGVTASYQTVASDLFQNHHGVLLGLFTQSEIKPIDFLTITAGARVDHIQYDQLTSDGQISPKLGISYQLTPEWTLRTSYGYGFRAPTIGERFTSSVISGFTVRPNLDLKSERSNSWEFGSDVSMEHWKLDAAVFYSTFDQLIEPTFVSSQGSPFVQFENVTKAEIFGHEEEIEYYPFADQSTMFRLGYTYVYPHDLTSGEILKFRPRHLLQAHAETGFHGFSIGSDFRYISSYETYDTTLAIQFVKDGDQRVPIYVLDARVGYTFNASEGWPVELTFQISNLLNYYYVEIVGNMAPTRSFSLQLQTHF